MATTGTTRTVGARQLTHDRPGQAPHSAAVRLRRGGRFGPGRLALLGLVAVLAVLGLTLLVSRASARTPVLVMVTDVPYAATITADDVGTAWVALDPTVVTVPASERDQVVGRAAATALHRGQLLTPSSTGTDVAPAIGQVLLGLAVPAGRMPTGGLSAGDHVLAVPLPEAGTTPSTPSNPVPATVVRIGDADLNGDRVVDVTVPADQGPDLARAAAGAVSLLLLPAGGH